MEIEADHIVALFVIAAITGVNVRLKNFGISAFSFCLLLVGSAKVFLL